MKRAWEKFISLASSDLGFKVVSVVIALGLWLFVNVGQKPAEWPFKVPIEFRNIPSDLMISNPGLDQIEVRVMGTPALLSAINPDHLKVVLDLDGARPGTSTFRLGADFFNPPRGVRVTRISPSVVHLNLEPVAVRSLPVSVRFEGKPPFGYKVTRVEVSPETIRVVGPAQEVNRMASVETELLELDGSRELKSRVVRLAPAGKLLTLIPDRVTVLVALEEEWMTREFRGVEVKAKDFAGEYSVSPRRVTLRLSGPKRILGRLQVGAEQVYLDLQGLGPGNHALALTLKLPPEIKVLEQRPDRFKIRIPSPKT